MSDVEYAHDPVMLAEVLEAFDAVPDGLVLDATLGGAGHARALLERRPGISLLGVDRDPAAIEVSTERLAAFGSRVEIRRARFGDLAELVGDRRLSGALFDLGVSSPQLDLASRGFSYRRPGPLDMRMDPTSGESAAELVDRADEDELAALFAANGEERLARRFARAIIAARPIATTTELAEVIERATPQAARRRGHPARRVFQSLRIAVNGELEQLAPALECAIDHLAPGGRVVALAYHSGEDRLVKALFAARASGGCTCPAGLPCVCGAPHDLRVRRRSARLASREEIAANPRAEPARLRILERVLEGAETDPTRPEADPWR